MNKKTKVENTKSSLKKGKLTTNNEGWRTTISHPVKVKNFDTDQITLLASGIDTLYISINVEWKNKDLFEFLSGRKKLAQETRQEVNATLTPDDNENKWHCFVLPNGTKGYEWILKGNEFTMKVGNWEKPKNMPSIQAEIRSETLWHLGPKQAVGRIIGLLNELGAKIISTKPSRIDLCTDFIFPEELWLMELIRYRVTRSRYAAPHLFNEKLTGISIGKGKISARLYDKPLEIKQQSKKTWMYDIWKIDAPPDNKKIIRVEFQLRREIIKEVGIDDISDLFPHIDNLWAYCTQKWLKFRSNPGKHHTQRKTFQWWQKLQNSFSGDQRATPLIRAQAMNAKEERLFEQGYGILTSLTALNMEQIDPEGNFPPNFDIEFDYFKRLAKARQKDGISFTNFVGDKRVNYQMQRQKMFEAHEKRILFGFPCNLPVSSTENKNSK